MNTTLPPAADSAWDAYLAMERSKQRHYDYLSALERKYENGGYQTNDETARLASLLAEHDENVRQFKRTVNDLSTKDLAAHQALIEHITLWNTELGSGSS